MPEEKIKKELDKRLKCREIHSNLIRNGVAYLGSKGSHGKYTKIIDERTVMDIIPCHGPGDEKSAQLVKKVREKFRISYEDFYNC
jgi:hypothetical protein